MKFCIFKNIQIYYYTTPETALLFYYNTKYKNLFSFLKVYFLLKFCIFKNIPIYYYSTRSYQNYVIIIMKITYIFFSSMRRESWHEYEFNTGFESVLSFFCAISCNKHSLLCHMHTYIHPSIVTGLVQASFRKYISERMDGFTIIIAHTKRNGKHIHP